jgi:CHAT domain-containing protein
MFGFNFKRLPGTRAEVEAIQGLFGTDRSVLYTDRDAREEVLLGTDAPRILHLATHGFFLEDQELSVDAGGRGLSLWDDTLRLKTVKDLKAVKKAVPVENPLLRSGIVLAGVNPAIKAGWSDGVVTAEKILGLKLRGTEMVVLSACETGLGDVKAGEGVFGLRRAFTQAGTKSLVMSLWSVPDEETKEMMIQFYKNVLSGKMNRCQALRQAALHEMQIVKNHYGFAHPFYWGAFVFLGEP